MIFSMVMTLIMAMVSGYRDIMVMLTMVMMFEYRDMMVIMLIMVIMVTMKNLGPREEVTNRYPTEPMQTTRCWREERAH